MLENDINIEDTLLDSNSFVLNPNNDDILCGYNTKRRAEHPGNIALRSYIEAKKAACNYKQLGKCEKTAVIDQTITHFKEIGRFLVDDTVQKGFRNADDSTIRVKVMRAFKDQSKIGNMDECVSVLHPTDTGSVLDENDNADNERGVTEENDEANEQSISVVNEITQSSAEESVSTSKPLSFQTMRKPNDTCTNKKGSELEANLDDSEHTAIGGKTMEADYDASDEVADGGAVDEGDDDANSVSSTKSYYRNLCVRLTFALEKKNAMELQTRKENQRLKEEIAQLRR